MCLIKEVVTNVFAKFEHVWPIIMVFVAVFWNFGDFPVCKVSGLQNTHLPHFEKWEHGKP